MTCLKKLCDYEVRPSLRRLKILMNIFNLCLQSQCPRPGSRLRKYIILSLRSQNKWSPYLKQERFLDNYLWDLKVRMIRFLKWDLTRSKSWAVFRFFMTNLNKVYILLIVDIRNYRTWFLMELRKYAILTISQVDEKSFEIWFKKIDEALWLFKMRSHP